MKLIIGVPVVVAVLLVGVTGKEKKTSCSVGIADVPHEWITMADACVDKMKKQVQSELEAAMTYMAMGAHFYKDSINRPGFGNFFFESASEEREHAIKIIEYLLMRGELKQDVRELIRQPKPLKSRWSNAVEALKDALKLEASVTDQLRIIAQTCESGLLKGTNPSPNDYHIVDYLSGTYLEEQYKGQRILAAHISDLGKMIDHNEAIGEFLYDKKLLGVNVA